MLRSSYARRVLSLLAPALVAVALIGCGTTKWSDTSRTATEQLLISSAMDDVIDEFNFYPLTGRKIYIESKGVAATDKEYLLSLLRQQLAANGTFVQETKETADYILEVSTGAVGTNRYDLMYGIPETSVPAVLTLGTATTIPEVPFVKRTDQKAQIKLTMWAYNKKTGAIIWQSGEKLKTASIRDRWILGAGPITKSSFSEKTQVGGDDVPFDDIFDQRISKNEKPSVKTEAIYHELDTGAIDHLETIRKEGLAALSKTAEPEKPAESTEKADENGETKTADKKPEAEKKPEKAPSEKEPTLKAEKLTDDAAPIKTAAMPEGIESPPTPPVNTANSAGAASSVAAAETTPTPLIRPTAQTLDFGGVTLPLGKTVVPSK